MRAAAAATLERLERAPYASSSPTTGTITALMPGQQQAVAHGRAELDRQEPVADRLHRPHAELHERRAHHQRHERERHERGGHGGDPAQPHRRHQVAAGRELGVARPAAREPLEHEQRERDRHEQRRQLHRGVAVERLEPDAVDRVR